MQAPDDFRNFGYLSSEANALRASANQHFEQDFQAVRNLVKEALDAISTTPLSRSLQHWVGLGFWIRAVEATQGAIILLDHGMGSTAAAALRTGLECLFYACAVWRNPERVAALQSAHEKETGVQINEMLKTGQGHLPKEHTQTLLQLQKEQRDGQKWSAFDAAKEADLVVFYNTAYRGLGLAGAHATLASLEDYLGAPESETPGVFVGPHFSKHQIIFSGAGMCLCIGIEHYRDFAAKQIQSPSTT